MHRPLTDLAIRRISPPASGTTEVWDGRLPGFGVRVSPGGARAFVLLYRYQGRPQRATLGRYPALSLNAARAKALKMLAQLADGHNPRGGSAVPNGTLSFESVVGQFIDKYARPKNKDWAETERLLTREFCQHWSGRGLSELTRQDVAGVIDDMVARGSPGAAVHALAAIRRLFGWAVERNMIEASPVQGLRPPVPIMARDRVLSDHELAAVWQAAEQLGYPFGAIIELLIRTGQRRGEIAGMLWRDLDFDARRWSIAADANKSGRPHEVPLTAATLRLLDDLPQLHSELVFPAQRQDPESSVSGFGRIKRRLDDLSGVTNWTLHDIRRTVATGMALNKVPPHVIERVLNHKSGTFAGVAGIYNRFGYLDEMRDALERWESYLTTVQAKYRTRRPVDISRGQEA